MYFVKILSGSKSFPECFVVFLRVEFRVLEKILLGSQPLSLYLWYLILTYSFSLCPSHSGLMHDHCSELHEPLAEDPGFSWLR